MDNTIQQINTLGRAINAIVVLFGTIILLLLPIAIPLFLMEPTYNLLLVNEWGEVVDPVYNVFVGITLVFFAVMVYVSWRLFAKKSFVAWLGATALMTMLVLLMFFAI